MVLARRRLFPPRATRRQLVGPFLHRRRGALMSRGSHTALWRSARPALLQNSAPSFGAAAQTTAASVSPAATAASCTETLTGFTYSTKTFSWNTDQVCTGAFGEQNQTTQMWRSSWSGPRGYGNWAATALTAANIKTYYRNIACNSGKGKYVYYPVMQGYATNIGWGPEVKSAYSLGKFDCETEPPS